MGGTTKKNEKFLVNVYIMFTEEAICSDKFWFVLNKFVSHFCHKMLVPIL